MRGTIVGVLRGGPSNAHDVSIESGNAMLQALSPERYTARDIFIDRVGAWHVAGRPVSPANALRSIDVALVGMHGEYGEDGGVQRMLEQFGVPYAGASAFPSYLASHKLLAKQKAQELGVHTPRYRYVESGTEAETAMIAAVRDFHQPVVVKPVRSGGSYGVSLQSGYAPIHHEVTRLLEAGAGGVLLEERLRGIEATVGLIEGFRGEELYALPVIEITPNDRIFSHAVKRARSARFTSLASLTTHVGTELVRIARLMHAALGLRHYSRTDFIVTQHGPYFLETNTLPPLADGHAFAHGLGLVGARLGDFLDHLIALARR